MVNLNRVLCFLFASVVFVQIKSEYSLFTGEYFNVRGARPELGCMQSTTVGSHYFAVPQ